MNFIKAYLILFLLFSSASAFSRNLILSNEEVIFSFKTQSGKEVTLSKDKTNRYIIYRFGTRKKIEFEFPEKTKESWAKFKYSYWLRGGGEKNEGIDLNYIAFINNEYKYIIYDTYFAVGNKSKVGIKIINLKTNKTVDIKGKVKTIKGSLVGFRDNNSVAIDDELYD